MILRDVLTVIVLLLPFTDWLAAVILLRAALRYPKLTLLRERALASILLSLAVTLWATLVLLGFGGVHLDPTIATLLAGAGVILPSVPAVIWLVLYFRGRFGESE